MLVRRYAIIVGVMKKEGVVMIKVGKFFAVLIAFLYCSLTVANTYCIQNATPWGLNVSGWIKKQIPSNNNWKEYCYEMEWYHDPQTSYITNFNNSSFKFVNPVIGPGRIDIVMGTDIIQGKSVDVGNSTWVAKFCKRDDPSC